MRRLFKFSPQKLNNWILILVTVVNVTAVNVTAVTICFQVETFVD